MSIRVVFRVQCDGPGREWLSFPEGGDWFSRDLDGTELVAAPTAERACNWLGERAARRAALAAGWRYGFFHSSRTWWFCPECQPNPLGISLPSSTPEQIAAVESGVMPQRETRCENVSVRELGSLRCTRQLGHTEEHVNGTVDWF